MNVNQRRRGRDRRTVALITAEQIESQRQADERARANAIRQREWQRRMAQ